MSLSKIHYHINLLLGEFFGTLLPESRSLLGDFFCLLGLFNYQSTLKTYKSTEYSEEVFIINMLTYLLLYYNVYLFFAHKYKLISLTTLFI